MRHVVLLIETSRAYGRGLLDGIARYRHEHDHWIIYCRPHGLGQPPPVWLKEWHGDGILVIGHQQMADTVACLGIPVVFLLGTRKDLPCVSVDEREVGRCAAEHLLSRGYRHFGFCGYERGYNPSLDLRGDEFRSFVVQAGGSCEVLRVFRPFYGPAESDSWRQQQHAIGQWIRSLPKPSAIMTCNDERGLQVLEVCRELALPVPEQVAVIGADNDQCLCNLAFPPLSSVDTNADQVGYTAAALLDRLMSETSSGRTSRASKRSKRAPPQHRRARRETQPVSKDRISICPRGVVLRQSTDHVAISIPEVASALQYIRMHAGERIRVSDVVKQISMSRTWLEQQLRASLGRTIHQEIQRVRTERVKLLLATTALPIKQVARSSGYGTVQYMTRAFRAQVGCTPAEYRRKMQAGPPADAGPR